MSMKKWSVIAGKWSDGIIKKFPYNSLREYSDKSTILRDVIIDPRKIIGSDHPSYHGVTWRDFLSKGKRVSDNIQRYKENPKYFGRVYQPKSYYDHWRLARIGDKYYICGGGNNRSLIAKYLAHERAMKSQIIQEVVHIET